jgi:hypothetical protein
MIRRGAVTLATILILLALLPMAAPADDASSSAAGEPATAPSTQPYVPHVAVVPPGYHAITVGDRVVWCQDADEDWVRAAVAAARPATRPTTMPSDVQVSIAQHRDALAAMIASDFGIDDRKDLDQSIDVDLLPQLAKLQALKPPVIFFPITRENLIQLLQNGWSDPRFRYNHFAQDVEYIENINLTIDHAMDDQVIWVSIRPTETIDAKRDALSSAISDFDYSYEQYLSLISQSGTRNVMANFLSEKILSQVKLQPTEEWFNKSAAQVFAIKYATFITGSTRQGLTLALLRGDPRNPLDWPPLDLVNPLNPDNMRAQYRVFYDNAILRKGAFAISAWITKGGDAIMGKTLDKLRATPPQNAADLIKAMQDASGIDPTPVMVPFYTEIPPSL